MFRARPKARTFGSFKMSVRRILQSRTYVGLQTDSETGEELRGDWDPLISEELWTIAHNAMSSKKNSEHPAHSSRPDEYPLKLVLKCPRCGDKFTAYKAKKKYPYYQCKGRDCSKRGLIPVALAHKQFEELLKGPSEVTGLIDAAIGQVESQALAEIQDCKIQRAVMERRIEVLKDSRSRYLDALVSDKISKSDFEAKDAGLQAEMSVLTSRLLNVPRMDSTFVEEAVLELRNLLSDPVEFWKDAPEHLRPELALAFFPDRVICENRELRTSDFLGISWVAAQSNGEKSQIDLDP